MIKYYKVLIFACAVCICFLFANISCRKFDTSFRLSDKHLTERFLDVPDDVPYVIKRVARAIEKQNNQYGFLPEFIRKQGLPVWNRSRVVAKTNEGTTTTSTAQVAGPPVDSIILVPLIKVDSNIVHSFLACHVEGDNVKIRLFDGSTASSFPKSNRLDTVTSSLVAMTAMYLDYLVNGREWFQITDTSVLHYANCANVVHITSPDIANRMQLVTSSYCVTVFVPYGWLVGVAPGEQNPYGHDETSCTFYSYWVDVIEDDLIYDGSTPPPPPGSGGGTQWWEDPCRVLPGGHCGGGGALPYTPIMPNQYNPYDAPHVDITGNLRDSFPCLYNLIRDTLENLNVISQVALNDIFAVSQYNHLTFKIDWTQTKDSGYVMRTREGRGDNSSGSFHFYDTILINPYFAKHSSKEKLIGSLVHEAIHAYINYCLESYSFGTNGIDSNYLKTHFPLDWQYFNNTAFTSQHQMMADDYFEVIKEQIYRHGNTSASSTVRGDVANSIAWGGLNKTSVWKTLSDTCHIKAVNAWSQEYNVGYSSMYLPGCGTYSNTFGNALQLTDPCH